MIAALSIFGMLLFFALPFILEALERRANR